MNKLLKFSMVCNALLFLLLSFLIIKNYDFQDILNKFSFHYKKTNEQLYSAHYLSRKSMFEKLPDKEAEIIFLGDSITANCNWYELFGNTNIKNRGIHGDTIHGISNRIDEIYPPPAKFSC